MRVAAVLSSHPVRFFVRTRSPDENQVVDRQANQSETLLQDTFLGGVCEQLHVSATTVSNHLQYISCERNAHSHWKL